jgi:2'-5' RNA ligase
VTRTFIALMISEEWAAYLGGLARNLAARMTGLSWVRPEHLHLTLRFMGDLDDSAVQRVRDSMARCGASEPAPLARLGALGVFPSLARPRVLWVGLAQGADAVSSLAKAVDNALRREGFGSPDKPIRPHFTLARVRGGAEGLDAISGGVVPPPPAAAYLDRVCVMKSELHPAGARYTALTEIRLGLPGGPAPTTPRAGMSPET